MTVYRGFLDLTPLITNPNTRSKQPMSASTNKTNIRPVEQAVTHNAEPGRCSTYTKS